MHILVLLSRYNMYSHRSTSCSHCGNYRHQAGVTESAAVGFVWSPAPVPPQGKTKRKGTRSSHAHSESGCAAGTKLVRQKAAVELRLGVSFPGVVLSPAGQVRRIQAVFKCISLECMHVLPNSIALAN